MIHSDYDVTPEPLPALCAATEKSSPRVGNRYTYAGKQSEFPYRDRGDARHVHITVRWKGSEGSKQTKYTTRKLMSW